MSDRRPRSLVAALAALALLMLAALAPLAAADHAYSHRYVVFGRVVDAENNPVPGLTVDLGYEKPFTPEGACANQPGTETEAFGPTRTSPVTNQFGEFTFCFHMHGMSRGTPGKGTIRVDALNAEKSFDFDGFVRYSFVDLKLATANPAANKTILDQQYTVQGRAWRATDSEIKVEGVGVYGDTLHNEDFEIKVEIDGRAPQTFNGTTNGYGDFAIRVPVEGRPTGGTVTFTIDGTNFTEPIDTTLGTTHFDAEFGERKTTPGAPILLAIGVVAVVALAFRRRE